MRNAKIMAVMAKLQASVGVPATLDSATDAMVAANIEIKDYQGSNVSSNIVRPQLGHAANVKVGVYNEISFEVEMNGSGTATVPPAFGVLLRGCALTETIDATPGAEHVAYDYVVSSSIGGSEYLTIEGWLDGEKHRLEDARGTVSFGLNNEGLPVAKFTFIGKYYVPEAVASYPSFIYTTFKDALPISHSNTPTFNFFGYEAAMSSFDFDIGLEQTWRNMPNFDGHVYSDRRSSGSVTFDSPELGIHNFYLDRETHNGKTLGAVNFEHGTQAGEIFNLSVSNILLTDLSRGESDGIMQYSASFNLLASDTAFKLIFK